MRTAERSLWFYYSLSILFLIGVAAMMSGCEPVMDNVGNTTVLLQKSTVCNPFSDESYLGADRDLGVVGSLFFVDKEDVRNRCSKANDYQFNGTLVDATIFMSNFDIPTKPFRRGFVTTEGNLIRDAYGKIVDKHFSLHFETVLQLRSGDVAGNYQFALLSDDGAVLKIDKGNGLETVVDGDGKHAMKMSCAADPVYLDQSSALPLNIDYYVGSRGHLGLVLLWREWPVEAESSHKKNQSSHHQWMDSECGAQGEGRFFNPGHWKHGKHTKTFEDLLARGWKVVPAGNLFLPAAFESNPCTEELPVETMITAVTPADATTAERQIKFEFLSNYPDAKLFCSLDGAAFAECASPMEFFYLSAGDHNFQVYAVSPKGVADETPSSYSWHVRYPVETNITSVSFESNFTNERFMEFGFTSNYPDAVFYCSIDGAAATQCADPLLYNDLLDGQHTFSVYAVNAWGEADATPDMYTWTVDTKSPYVIAASTTTTATSVVIAWTTNELSTTALYWGLFRDPNMTLIPDDGIYALNHSVNINGLAPRTIYSFIIAGHDQAGNTVVPVNRGFMTQLFVY